MFLNCLPRHDYHMSMTEMRYDTKNKRITIATKVFIDDMQNTLKKVYNMPLVFQHTAADSVHNFFFEHYFESRMDITRNRTRLKPQFLGFEYDQDICWIYLEVPNVKPWKELQLSQRIFFELFDDQQNIVHVYSAENKRSSCIFTAQEKVQTLSE